MVAYEGSDQQAQDEVAKSRYKRWRVNQWGEWYIEGSDIPLRRVKDDKGRIIAYSTADYLNEKKMKGKMA